MWFEHKLYACWSQRKHTVQCFSCYIELADKLKVYDSKKLIKNDWVIYGNV